MSELGCTSVPISWWRLERYRLAELPHDEQHEIEQHLTGCAVCRACLARVDTPVELPELPAGKPSSARRRAWLRWSGAAAVLSAAAAATLLLLPHSGGPGLEPPGRRIAFKGGELAIDLVRERAGSIARDATQFRPGDRWKVLLTCPPPLQPHVDVVVFQGREAFFPIAPTQLSTCGNLRALPGAFALDGHDDALVCATVSERMPLDRAALAARGLAALPAQSVCLPLAPAER
jgi:hypothetical protein